MQNPKALHIMNDLNEKNYESIHGLRDSLIESIMSFELCLKLSSNLMSISCVAHINGDMIFKRVIHSKNSTKSTISVIYETN